MTKIGTVAAALGILAGGWTLFGVYFGYLAQQYCGSGACYEVSFYGTVLEAVGALLVLASLVSFMGPKVVFYLSALLAAIIGAIVLILPADTFALVLAMALAVGEFVASVAAARRRTGVSEQSHPMNLPVFG